MLTTLPSPENCGVFPLLKEVTFRRILSFYNSGKCDHFMALRSRFVDLVLFTPESSCGAAGLETAGLSGGCPNPGP
jgi:hypothetical protein